MRIFCYTLSGFIIITGNQRKIKREKKIKSKENLTLPRYIDAIQCIVTRKYSKTAIITNGGKKK